MYTCKRKNIKFIFLDLTSFNNKNVLYKVIEKYGNNNRYICFYEKIDSEIERFLYNSSFVCIYDVNKYSSKRLLASLKRVFNGDVLLSPNKMFENRIISKLPNDPVFTKREKDVLVFLEKGLSTKEIAFYLGISFNTVKVHIYKIYKKMKIRKRVELIRRLSNLEEV